MKSHVEGACPHCIAVQGAIHALFNPAEPKHFSGKGQRWPGWSDRAAGVQWSIWHDVKERRVEMAVNLEGMYDGADWPIGRVIERERTHPQLSILCRSAGDQIDAWVGRDTWNPSGQGKNRIDDIIGIMPATSLGDVDWVRAMNEARQYQGPDLQGPAVLPVKLLNGKVKDCRVSPHIQFTTFLWGSDLPSYQHRPGLLTAARARLQPFHELMFKLATP